MSEPVVFSWWSRPSVARQIAEMLDTRFPGRADHVERWLTKGAPSGESSIIVGAGVVAVLRATDSNLLLVVQSNSATDAQVSLVAATNAELVRMADASPIRRPMSGLQKCLILAALLAAEALSFLAYSQELITWFITGIFK